MSDSASETALSLALGRCDELRAEVFVRAASSSAAAPPRISGTLAGPHRGRDTTLPVTAKLEPTAAPGAARAILTEPAYWSPDLPNLYRLRATLERGDSAAESIDHLVGLRRLGVRGRSLWLDGHRWVPRGRVAGGPDFAACKAASVAAVITDPDDATLARADEIGVAVLALVTAAPADDPASLAHRIAAWSAHPAAAVAILPQDMPPATVAATARATIPLKGTLLLAATVSGTAPPPTMPTGIDALVLALDLHALPHEAWLTGANAPVIAWRCTDASPTTGRAPCDTLQAELARWASRDSHTRAWDWAGYVVG